MTAAVFEERLNIYLKDNGLKQTQQRRMLLEAFLGLSGHVRIDTLHAAVQERMPGVGYATVYRSMKLFCDAGIAQERKFGDGQARYEVVTDDHHDHLICSTCGHIYEFEDPVIEERQDDIARHYGMRVQSHRHEIVGECLEPVTCPHNQGAV
ncbi:MAG: transcriptional repressor [Myxococcota bacterium]|nr:transcriptional repressor [Myxococcota bacterium]